MVSSRDLLSAPGLLGRRLRHEAVGSWAGNKQRRENRHPAFRRKLAGAQRKSGRPSVARGPHKKTIAGGGTVGESEACLPGTAGVLLENIRLFEAGGGHG